MPEKRHREHGEGSIFTREVKRKDGTTRTRYGFSVTRPNGQRVQRLFDSKKKRDAELLAVRSGQKALAAASISLDGYLVAWLEKVAKPRVGESTFDHYTLYVNEYLRKGLGKIRLDRLTPAMVQGYLTEQLEAGVAPRTVHHLRAILRNALNTAIKWELITRNAAALADPPKIPKVRRKRLTMAEAHTLLTAIHGHRYEALLVLTLVTGLRQGEILGIWWDDLDLEAGVLHLRHQLQYRGHGTFIIKELKTDTDEAYRPMALPAQLALLLRARKATQVAQRDLAEDAWDTTWPLVFTTELGRPITAASLWHVFQTVLRHAGLPPMRFHDLRGSCATFLAALGVHPRVAAEYLGHADIRTTMLYYTDVLPESRREASELLAGALWGPKSGNETPAE